ncbi:MAG: addiction module protein [Nannocystaceae bacterium]
MGDVAERLLAKALTLSGAERLHLAEQIVRSVDHAQTDPEWRHAWRAELDRRLARMQAGPEEDISLDDVRQRLASMTVR